MYIKKKKTDTFRSTYLKSHNRDFERKLETSIFFFLIVTLPFITQISVYIKPYF